MVKSLMVQGTGSDVGKSTVVAGLCRVLTRRNVSVAPFKPQNMALNSAVTPDGGEIGRAQAFQALACKIPLSVDMNPVLLKPNSDIGAQVIFCGKAHGNMSATTYHDYKPKALSVALGAYTRLSKQHDLIVIEGAGSPAEINLRENDIANMGFALEVDSPVILVGDIDKGGVFAQFVGTLELLSEDERALVKGFIINKFRGDLSLLASGISWLEEKTGKPVFGVLPYHRDLFIDAEDAIDSQQHDTSGEALEIVVPLFSRISNHSDFDALRLHPNVDLRFVSLDEAPPACDLIILPGTKNVRGDLSVLQKSVWPQAIEKHLRYGGKLLGICGGYQMLGKKITDAFGIEGRVGATQALGLLNVETHLARDKTLVQRKGSLVLNEKMVNVTGYEIHHGKTHMRGKKSTPLLHFDDDSFDGYLSEDKQIMGAYLHGLFDCKQSCDLLLEWAGLRSQTAIDVDTAREDLLESLADSLEQHLDIDALMVLLQ